MIKPSNCSSKEIPESFIIEISDNIVERLIHTDNIVINKDDEENITYNYDQWINNCHFILSYDLLYPALIHLKYTLDDEYDLSINKKDTEEYNQYLLYKSKCKVIAEEYK
jgi:methyl coenzyme M reductase subunit D